MELLKTWEPSQGHDLESLLFRILYALQFLWVMGVLDSRTRIVPFILELMKAASLLNIYGSSLAYLSFYRPIPYCGQRTKVCRFT